MEVFCWLLWLEFYDNFITFAIMNGTADQVTDYKILYSLCCHNLHDYFVSTFSGEVSCWCFMVKGEISTVVL